MTSHLGLGVFTRICRTHTGETWSDLVWSATAAGANYEGEKYKCLLLYIKGNNRELSLDGEGPIGHIYSNHLTASHRLPYCIHAKEAMLTVSF